MTNATCTKDEELVGTKEACIQSQKSLNCTWHGEQNCAQTIPTGSQWFMSKSKELWYFKHCLVKWKYKQSQIILSPCENCYKICTVVFPTHSRNYSSYTTNTNFLSDFKAQASDCRSHDWDYILFNMSPKVKKKLMSKTVTEFHLKVLFLSFKLLINFFFFPNPAKSFNDKHLHT